LEIFDLVQKYLKVFDSQYLFFVIQTLDKKIDKSVFHSFLWIFNKILKIFTEILGQKFF
jgi:hypothetical protein